MKYEYDAAGRLVKEGDKEYHYIGLDKIESVMENGRRLSSFSYHIDGQLAEAVTPEKREFFQWDGLALIQRNSTNYVNEPAVTGGNPILADDKVLFNDMLGTTLGIKDGDKVTQNHLTAFGESLSASPMQDSFFTGKPHVGEMGYVFLFRAYRADQGKWQTADPLGYPDGWNNFAYVNNRVADAIDLFGALIYDLCDRNAVGGYGHSAQIVTVQNPDGTWTAYTYDYGQGSSGSGANFATTVSTATTEVSARDAAVQKLDPNGNKYDNMSVWNANNQQSQAAKDSMDTYIQDGYNPGWHNCRGVLNDGLEAAGYVKGDDFSAKTAPAIANTEDIGLGTARDLTKTLKTIQKGYAE